MIIEYDHQAYISINIVFTLYFKTTNHKTKHAILLDFIARH